MTRIPIQTSKIDDNNAYRSDDMDEKLPIVQCIFSHAGNEPELNSELFDANPGYVEAELAELRRLYPGRTFVVHRYIPESRIRELETRVEVMERETKQIADESGCMRHSERHCGMTEAFGMVREEIRKLLET